MTDPTAGERRKGRLVAHPEPGKVWVQVPHRNDIGSDWFEADELPAPATPDAGDASEPLSEAERAMLLVSAGKFEGDPSIPGLLIAAERIASAAATQARAEGRQEAMRDVGLWATQRKAFMEASRERERAIDRNRVPTLSSEFWRGHESALDDLIRTVTADEPTDPAFRVDALTPDTAGEDKS